jgi:hypothetical protein
MGHALFSPPELFCGVMVAAFREPPRSLEAHIHQLPAMLVVGAAGAVHLAADGR